MHKLVNKLCYKVLYVTSMFKVLALVPCLTLPHIDSSVSYLIIQLGCYSQAKSLLKVPVQ